MLQALRERRHDDRGFTLIELMIVVLIIGILIAVGLPTFLGARNRAQDRAAQAVLRNGVTAAKTWYTDGSTYTGFTATTAAAIEPSITWTGTAITTSTATGTIYIKSATANTLCLWSVSANGPTLWYASDTGTGTTITTTAC